MNKASPGIILIILGTLYLWNKGQKTASIAVTSTPSTSSANTGIGLLVDSTNPKVVTPIVTTEQPDGIVPNPPIEAVAISPAAASYKVLGKIGMSPECAEAVGGVCTRWIWCPAWANIEITNQGAPGLFHIVAQIWATGYLPSSGAPTTKQLAGIDYSKQLATGQNMSDTWEVSGLSENIKWSYHQSLKVYGPDGILILNISN